MEYSPRCQLCGAAAPSRQTKLYQNVGMLIMRKMKTLDAVMCKSCVHSNYWSMTGTTLAIGWLGTISLVIAPCIVLYNTFVYLTRLGMPAAPKA